jgi:hypothetical protein
VNHDNDERHRSAAPTELYLVRIWRRKSGDGALNLHGKLQHVVSGASSYFDGLSGLPEALAKMIEQVAGALGPKPDGGNEAGEGKPDTS